MNDKIEVGIPQFEIHNVNDNSDDEALPPKEREQIKIHRVSYLSKGRQGKQAANGGENSGLPHKVIKNILNEEQ